MNAGNRLSLGTTNSVEHRIGDNEVVIESEVGQDGVVIQARINVTDLLPRLLGESLAKRLFRGLVWEEKKISWEEINEQTSRFNWTVNQFVACVGESLAKEVVRRALELKPSVPLNVAAVV